MPSNMFPVTIQMWWRAVCDASSTGFRAALFLSLAMAWPAWAGAPFIVNTATSTVFDSITGLEWDQCPYGMTDSTCTTGSPWMNTWQNAMLAVANANSNNYKGSNDWRVPNRNELESLVKISSPGPAIDKTAFPNTPRDYFWTSTNNGTDGAWYVYFENGHTASNLATTSSHFLRLVRGGYALTYFDSIGAPPVSPPVCTPIANPASISSGNSSTLTANCPTATSYSWTGGTCAGTTAPTCTVTPASTITYFVTGTNSGVSGTAASVTVTVTPSLSSIPAAERQILLNIYNATNGASWSNRTNWLGPVGTECTWIGVGCNAALNHVEVLSLSPNNLTGTLPSINGLVALRVIDFAGNQLTGQIPSLSGLAALQGIWVGYNQLTGALPSFSGLAALQSISAPYNQLTGSIPSLSDQVVLQSFVVDNNRLTGPVPAAPSSLSTGGSDLCGNSLVSSGNPAIDIAWQNATARNWLACQTASAAPVCHVAATPTTIRKNGTSILTPTCTPAATTYLWTGGTCQGTTAPTCTVTPTATTTYGVTGTNSYGSSTANAQVTVRAVDLTPILMLLLD